jgi:hypothetical protein
MGAARVIVPQHFYALGTCMEMPFANNPNTASSSYCPTLVDKQQIQTPGWGEESPLAPTVGESPLIRALL